MHNHLYLLGASGHAKVVLEILQASGKELTGLFDDNRAIENLLGYKVIGSIDDSMQYRDARFIVGIGNNRIRERIAKRAGFEYEKAQHPAAIISGSSCIGSGTVVMAGAIVNAGTSVGRHAILNTRSSVDHDCVLDDFVHISPGATLAGNVRVGEGSHVGTGAVIIPGVVVGKWAVIGAGAVIIRNVPDYAVVVGNPGRILKMIPPV